MVDQTHIKKNKKPSGIIWFIAIVALAIWGLNSYGNYRDQQMVTKTTQEAQSAEILRQKCTQENFMHTTDPAAIPGKLEIVSKYYAPAGGTSKPDDGTYEKSFNAWMADGCN